MSQFTINILNTPQTDFIIQNSTSDGLNEYHIKGRIRHLEQSQTEGQTDSQIPTNTHKHTHARTIEEFVVNCTAAEDPGW